MQRKVEERILETLKVPNAKDLLATLRGAEAAERRQRERRGDAGRPIVAFPSRTTSPTSRRT
jgi:hypothetical protein